ncbi:MAG: hypothetical protein JWR38_3993 [Mucilaginibacter sp.]|nr:hypothetical protein [Mucilaginibacter sp.]
MEPIMLFVIAAIIAAIILVAFNKQQESKMSHHLYTDDVKQLYQLTTAEYKINALENQQQLNEANHITGSEARNIAQELDLLTTAFESGEIPLNELNSKLDYLLNEFNISNASMAEVY